MIPYQFRRMVEQVVTAFRDSKLKSFAQASAALTLTGSNADIVGATLTLNPGAYLVTGVFAVQGTTNDVGNVFVGTLYVNGIVRATAATQLILANSSSQNEFNITYQWLITITGGSQIVKLNGRKTGGTGTSVVSDATISAI